MESLTFYWSFRSPYAWLAFHRLGRALAGLPVEVERIPVFPPPDFPNDPAAIPAKSKYIAADVERIAAAYGLPLRWPRATDTNWMRPHAAYLHAADAGRGEAFALATYAARFSEGRDVGDDDTLRRVAAAVELDRQVVVRAADDAALHERVMMGMRRALGDGVFGVPFFVYRGRTFWGNDRLEWLAREIARDAGRRLPDLHADPVARPY